jgi:prepilin-type N-terminal cleavage/methylation domain-containing protein
MVNKGFSLIEMLVVVVVIGVLATFGHTLYLTYVERSKISEALSVLEEYQAAALAYRARYGTFSAYYALFTSSDQSGLVTGSPTDTSAEKQINMKYVQNITADTGTSGSNTYILLGAELQHDGIIISGSDFVYMAGVQTPAGIVTWECGTSASKGNTINSNYLPATCQASLP